MKKLSKKHLGSTVGGKPERSVGLELISVQLFQHPL
jgi:hypothetical protein